MRITTNKTFNRTRESAVARFRGNVGPRSSPAYSGGYRASPSRTPGARRVHSFTFINSRNCQRRRIRKKSRSFRQQAGSTGRSSTAPLHDGAEGFRRSREGCLHCRQWIIHEPYKPLMLYTWITPLAQLSKKCYFEPYTDHKIA